MFWFPTRNFGDAMSPFIVVALGGATPLYMPRPTARRLLAVGSIVHRAEARDVVWGSGCIEDARLHLSRSIRVTAVRGPLTRALIDGVDVPECYGDPALLLPHFYDPAISAAPGRIGLLLHYTDVEEGRHLDYPPELMAISPLDDWRSVVTRIRSCELLITTSLHGLIVADAYGVPAVWAKLGNRVRGGEFKFRDHLAASDRDPKGPQMLLDAISSPRVLPRVELSTARLLRALDVSLSLCSPGLPGASAGTIGDDL